MNSTEPAGELDQNFSSPEAVPTSWAEAHALLEQAEVYWLTTVRPDGRPHVTPLIAVWLDGAFYFCTGDDERKAKNLARNAHCVITTGGNGLSGLDLVVEGDAAGVSGDATLQRVAACYGEKYGPPFQFSVRDGGFFNGEGFARLYRLTPAKALAFGKGETFSQTRFRF